MPSKSKFIHCSSPTLNRIGRLVVTDISITEEAEPCELHEEISCTKCQNCSTKNKMSQILKRSISHNAVNNLKRRNSIPGLHKTLSQTSLYSTGSTKSQNLNRESFNEFLIFLNGEDYYETEHSLWENLPKETRDIFVARVLAKKQSYRKKELNYNDIRHLFEGEPTPPKGSFMHYRNKLGPHFRQSAPGLQEQTISKIIGQLYNYELTESDRDLLKKEAHEVYQNATNERLEYAREYISRAPRMVDKDPHLEEIKAWRDKQDIDAKLKELNALVGRIEQYLPSPVTATTDDAEHTTLIGSTPSSSKFSSSYNPTVNVVSNGGSHSGNGKKPPTIMKSKMKKTDTKETFAAMIASKSKKLVQRFKRKKRPAALDLYREPSPTVRVVIAAKQAQQTQNTIAA